MKNLIIILLLISLSSFGAGEQKEESISLVSETDIICTTSLPVAANQSLSEQISVFFSSVLDTQWWPARWQCGIWSPFHGWLYILSDLTIALSYFLIPLILLYFINKQKHQPSFRFVVWLFISFILACGLTHLIDAAIFWWPAYRLNALIRFVTAAISLTTVFALVKTAPQLLQLKSPETLQRVVLERTEELRKSMLLVTAYQRALDESSIVAITNHHGTIQHVNENFCKISKYTKEELIGKDHRIINSGYHSKEYISALWKTIGAGKIWKGELKNKAKDGTIYWVDTTIVPFVNEEGKPYQYVAIRADITERKLVEDNLQKSLKETSDYKYALEESSIVAITDQRGIIKYANENFCKISKYSRKELIGEDHRIINSGYHSKAFIGELWKTITAGKIWKGELKNKAKDGTIYWVDTTIVPFLNEKGKPYQYVAIRSDITARKKAENEQAILASIVNSSVDAIIGKNMDSMITSWNKGSERVFGYTAEEAVGKHISMLIPTGRINEEDEIIKKISGGNYIDHYETERLRKNGSLVPVSITISPIKDVHGNIIGASKIARDISDRKKAEEEIIKSEKRFRGLIENSNDIIRLSDRDFKPIYRSPNLERITGWANEDIEEEGDFMLVHPDDRGKMVSMLNEIKSNPEKIIPFTYRLKHKAGHFIWVEGTGINMLHDESTKGIITNFRDVTERKRAEEKLAASEMRFRMLIENSADGIDLSDESSNNIYRSPGAVKITGILPKDNQRSLTHPDDLEIIKNKSEELIKKPGIPIAFQARFRHAQGHYIWMEGTFTNLLHVEGVHAIVTNFRDITHRKELEVLLHKANSLARIGSWELDPIKESIYWSDITKEIHETEMDYVPDLVTGINFYKAGEGRDLITKKLKEAIEQGKPWDVELQLVTAKNNERWVRSIGEAEFVNGKCIRIYGSFQDIDKRKRAEEKLIESERLYRSIYENTGEAILLTIPNGTIISANAVACQIFDRTEEEICTLGRSGLVNTLDPRISDGLEERKKTGLFKGEWTFVKRDGTIFPGEISSTVFKNSEGEERTITIIRDITERKKSEEKLSTERTLLRTLIDNLPDYIYVKDTNSRHLINNKANVELIGASTEAETIGKTAGDYLRTESARTFHEDDQLVFQSGKPIVNREETIISPTGEVKYLLTTKVPLIDETNVVTGLVGISRDITWQKQIELELREKTYFLEKAQQVGQIGYWISEVGTGKLTWSAETCRIFGIEPVEFDGQRKTFFSFVHPDDLDKLTAASTYAVENNQNYRIEHRTILRDGAVKWVFQQGEANHDQNGQSVIIGIVQDITERKKVEEEIKELNISLEGKVSERTKELQKVNKELEAFSYSVSHDLRAPLRAINGYAKMLEEDYRSILDDNGKRLLGIVQHNANQMGTLIDDLLSLSRLGRKELHKSSVDMGALANSIITEMPTSNAKIVIGTLPKAGADAGLIRQVLVNLISNAVKYSSKTKKPVVEMGSFKEASETVYYIKDNGAGFDMAYAPKLFGVFQRLHSQEEFEGTGIGLAIVKLIIEKHNGRVWAEGELGKGATFFFSLPVSNV